jgi:hypothetical protein
MLTIVPVKPEDYLYLVVASIYTPGEAGADKVEQKSIVGIATDYEQAESLVNQDYIELLTTNKLKAYQHPLKKAGDTQFAITDAFWNLISVPKNKMLNFTL